MTTKTPPPCAPTPTQRGSKQGKRFSTAKVMRTKKPYVFALPFGAGQTLLKFQTPTHYTSGINGWKCNYYPTNHAMAGVVAGADTKGAHTHKISLELYTSYAEHAETLHTTERDNPRLPQLLDNWLILLLDRAIKEVQRSESAPRLPRGRPPKKAPAPKNLHTYKGKTYDDLKQKN